MKMSLLFTVISLVLTISIYGWLLFKAFSGISFTQSDMWASIVVPLYVIGWTSSRKRRFPAYEVFLLTATICTGLDIYMYTYPSIFLLLTTMVGTLILPIQYILQAAKKQE